MRQATMLGVLLLGACTANTGVEGIEPDFTPAVLVPPPQQAAVRLPRAQITPTAKLRGSQAIARAAKSVVVQPTDRDVVGTTWTIDDVDSTKIYAIPVQPMAPTTIFLPLGETLATAVGGTTEDITLSSAVSGNRAAITVRPTCANPKSERFDTVGTYEPDEHGNLRPALEACMIGTADATFLTNEGPYSFRFVITDYTAATIVLVNHAPPPVTERPGVRVPQPDGPVTELQIAVIGNWNPGWQPVRAWADPWKMVIHFNGPLPTLPGLFPMGGTTNYSVLEVGSDIYMVTSRRVTEAELRLDKQTVRITDPTAKLIKSASVSTGGR
jgi:hypothetical protein